MTGSVRKCKELYKSCLTGRSACNWRLWRLIWFACLLSKNLSFQDTFEAWEMKKIWIPIASFCIILGLLSHRVLIEGLTAYFLKHMNPAIANTFTPLKILQYVVFAITYGRSCLNLWFPSYAVLSASCVLQGLNEWLQIFMYFRNVWTRCWFPVLF